MIGLIITNAFYSKGYGANYTYYYDYYNSLSFTIYYEFSSTGSTTGTGSLINFI